MNRRGTDYMGWRIALVDSCGAYAGMAAAARFERRGPVIAMLAPGPDSLGHGTRLADIIAGQRSDVTLTLAQVFDSSGHTAADVVAAAIDWCVETGVDLLHLSLGLRADRAVLAAAIARAIDCGCVVVASRPARGAVPYPAAYPRVLRATGDARCNHGQVSRLADMTFGGCPSALGGRGAGASIGAAHVTRELTLATEPCPIDEAIGVLAGRATWHGPERRDGP